MKKSTKALVSWTKVESGTDGRKVMVDNSLKRNGHIYHMLQWDYAKAIFENGRLRLSPVSSWQDPYEKWWCGKLFGRPSALSEIHAYGSCWTTGAYDEPRWRMAGFGKATPIVRIRSNVGALLETLTDAITDQQGSVYVGRVVYCGERLLRSLAQSVTVGAQKEVTRTAATMLLHKRRAFKFENEVRCLWLDRRKPTDALWMDIDARRIISDVMISPGSDASHQGGICFYRCQMPSVRPANCSLMSK